MTGRPPDCAATPCTSPSKAREESCSTGSHIFQLLLTSAEHVASTQESQNSLPPSADRRPNHPRRLSNRVPTEALVLGSDPEIDVCARRTSRQRTRTTRDLPPPACPVRATPPTRLQAPRAPAQSPPDRGSPPARAASPRTAARPTLRCQPRAAAGPPTANAAHRPHSRRSARAQRHSPAPRTARTPPSRPAAHGAAPSSPSRAGGVRPCRCARRLRGTQRHSGARSQRSSQPSPPKTAPT